jgi:hypothetical protein
MTRQDGLYLHTPGTDFGRERQIPQAGRRRARNKDKPMTCS